MAQIPKHAVEYNKTGKSSLIEDNSTSYVHVGKLRKINGVKPATNIVALVLFSGGSTIVTVITVSAEIFFFK